MWMRSKTVQLEPDREQKNQRPRQTMKRTRKCFASVASFCTTVFFGPVGGIRAVHAGSGPVGSLRVQLMTEFFAGDGFIAPDNSSSYFGGALSISGTVWDHIEVWGSIASWATRHSNSSPRLFHAMGDVQLGVKGFYDIDDVFSVGGDLRADFLNTVGDIGLVFASTTPALRANFSADLRGLESSFPLIVRANVGYQFNNSFSLVDDVEDARYQNLDDPASERRFEHRHLINGYERHALKLSRHDFLQLAVGLEAPLTVMEDFYVSPIVEWTWDIPVNRQNYSCLYRPDGVAGDAFPVPDEYGIMDGCLERAGLEASPMNLTFGVRVNPFVPGLAVTLAGEVALLGQNKIVRELAANTPLEIHGGSGLCLRYTSTHTGD